MTREFYSTTKLRSPLVKCIGAAMITLVSLPILLQQGQAMTDETSTTPLSFGHPAELDKWSVVNDTVMGGVSSSSLSSTHHGMRFTGVLSLENNGGFASVRRFGGRLQLSGTLPLKLTVKGDGRTYQLRLRTGWETNSVAYAASFETIKGEPLTHSFVAEDFTPVWRGRRVQGAPPLRFAEVLQPGFMLADKTPGEFSLEIISLVQ